LSGAAPAGSVQSTVSVGAGDTARQVLVADRGGERLDVFLARSLPDCSRAGAQRLIDAGAVTVAGRAERAAHRLAQGDSVTVVVPPLKPTALQAETMPLHVLYQDADVIAIDKPAGMVVHPAAGHQSGTLVHGLLALCTDLSGIGGEERPGIVHRLDRDTSGVLLVAKNDRAHASLSRQFEQRTVRKHYLALLRVPPLPAEGVIDAPIGRDPARRQRMGVVERGRPSRTVYHTLATAGRRALVVARLDTGRTHQLRVHFTAIGCPIDGDPLYGGGGVGVGGRLWLHAWRLEFDRPSDGARVVLEAELPAALRDGWQVAVTDSRAADPEPLEILLSQARGWAIRPT
jgi:23S rRNA pseudouridine1911/1915/1917 synthase